MEEKNGNKIFLRRATMEDAEDILRWRNDETARANSFNKDVIDLETHKKWFARKLADPNCYLFILMDEDEKVGNVRIDVDGDVGEISTTVAPEKRGRGYGKMLIALVEKEMPKEVKTLMGTILKENRASEVTVLVNGYSATDAGDAVCYSKRIN